MNAVLELEPRLDLTAATRLATAIREQEGGDLVLEAAETTHLSTACVQVLLAARAEWMKNGHILSLRNLDTECRDQLELLGLDPSDLAIEEETG